MPGFSSWRPPELARDGLRQLIEILGVWQQRPLESQATARSATAGRRDQRGSSSGGGGGWLIKVRQAWSRARLASEGSSWNRTESTAV